MPLAVCTLFEGNYHHGVAALCNSLYTNGYRGIVYAGYRGDLPPWSDTAKSFDSPESNSNHSDIKVFHAADGLDVYFIKLEVGSHLAHHKPEFMLQLLEGLAKNMTGIVYFDPDIVVKCNWTFFNNWMQNGVGIVQEINGNIMPIHHPTRFLWRHVADVAGEKVINPVQYYY